MKNLERYKLRGMLAEYFTMLDELEVLARYRNDPDLIVRQALEARRLYRRAERYAERIGDPEALDIIEKSYNEQ